MFSWDGLKPHLLFNKKIFIISLPWLDRKRLSEKCTCVGIENPRPLHVSLIILIATEVALSPTTTFLIFISWANKTILWSTSCLNASSFELRVVNELIYLQSFVSSLSNKSSSLQLWNWNPLYPEQISRIAVVVFSLYIIVKKQHHPRILLLWTSWIQHPCQRIQHELENLTFYVLLH